MQKKTWQKPQLIVLARGKPEDTNLLALCKNSAASGNAAMHEACWLADVGACPGVCALLTST